MEVNKQIKNRYFLLINYSTKESYLCSWFENEPNYFGRKVFFIGNRGDGLGGYKSMIDRGFVDRRTVNELTVISKVVEYKTRKRAELIKKYYDDFIKLKYPK